MQTMQDIIPWFDHNISSAPTFLPRRCACAGGDGAHITSSEQYFRFGGNITEVYQGKKAARGVFLEAHTANRLISDPDAHQSKSGVYPEYDSNSKLV